jgi:hypothetical protein
MPWRALVLIAVKREGVVIMRNGKELMAGE